MRARIAAVSVQRVKKSEVSKLTDLTKSDLKGRVCTRVGSHVYNRALLASIIANDGENAAAFSPSFAIIDASSARL